MKILGIILLVVTLEVLILPFILILGKAAHNEDEEMADLFEEEIARKERVNKYYPK